MGAGVSAPTLPVDDIQLVAAEVSKTFTPAYAAAFGTHLLKDIKKARTASPKEFLLERAPPPSDPLWTGTLSKLGAVRRSWKSRHFVVKNEADNYTIQYFVDAAAAAAGKQPKGSINLCWYRVERCTTDEDKAAYGEHSMRLKPWWSSDRRRTWFVRASSAAELDAALPAFEIAARKADAPLNPDPVMRAAFKDAMTKTRHKLTEFGWFYFAADEAGQLAMLVSDRCERGCMREVYAKVPSGAMQSVVRRQVQKSLDTTVGAATSAAWRAASSSLMAQKPELRKRADETAGPIFTMQAELQARIRDSVNATLEPRIAEGVSPLVGALADAFLSTLRRAYEQSIGIFSRSMLASADKHEGWQDALTSFARSVNYSNGVLKPSFDAVRELTQMTGAISTGVGAASVSLTTQDVVGLLCGVELWQVERVFEDGIRGLARAAVYTLRKRTSTEAHVDKAAAIAGVVADYVHDAQLQAFNDVLALFMSVVKPPLEKDVLPRLTDALAPISSAVPDAMKAFIDVDELLHDLAMGIATDAISAAILPGARAQLKPLEALAGTLPVKPFKGGAEMPAPSASAAAAVEVAPAPAPAPAMLILPDIPGDVNPADLLTPPPAPVEVAHPVPVPAAPIEAATPAASVESLASPTPTPASTSTEDPAPSAHVHEAAAAAPAGTSEPAAVPAKQADAAAAAKPVEASAGVA